MIEAEMRGIPAVLFLAVIDSHYVTSETLQVYTPIVNGLLGINLMM